MLCSPPSKDSGHGGMVAWGYELTQKRSQRVVNMPLMYVTFKAPGEPELQSDRQTASISISKII